MSVAVTVTEAAEFVACGALVAFVVLLVFGVSVVAAVATVVVPIWVLVVLKPGTLEAVEIMVGAEAMVAISVVAPTAVNFWGTNDVRVVSVAIACVVVASSVRSVLAEVVSIGPTAGFVEVVFAAAVIFGAVWEVAVRVGSILPVAVEMVVFVCEATDVLLIVEKTVFLCDFVVAEATVVAVWSVLIFDTWATVIPTLVVIVGAIDTVVVLATVVFF